MKSATLPAVRIEASLREEIEQALNAGESLSAFVEASVRESLRRRVEQSEFIRRGIASIDAARKSGKSISADTAVRRLEDRLAKARTAQARKRGAAE